MSKTRYWVRPAKKYMRRIVKLIGRKFSKEELEDKIFEQIGNYEHEVRSKRDEKSE